MAKASFLAVFFKFFSFYYLIEMPIYSYKCSNCGYTKDVLQKYSDAPITPCPKCNMKTMVKQLSAPGFELNGKVWYATDFKGGSSAALPASHCNENCPAKKDK